jgi:arginine deiminase
MKPRITSEYGKLKSIMIHTPGPEHLNLVPWEGEHVLLGSNPRALNELREEHGCLKNFLVSEIGKENVHEVTDLLRYIFEQADKPKRVEVLKEILFRHYDPYTKHLSEQGIRLEDYDSGDLVRDLVQGYPRELILDESELPTMIIPPKRELMWMRDSSAVTPAGVVINVMASMKRFPESELVRAVYKYHPMFDEDSIFLDMVQHYRQMESDESAAGLLDKKFLEGGNILILNEETIAVGVGSSEFYYSNRTTRQAFYLFVRRLFEADKTKKIRRVYLVNVPDLRGFIHLDTAFNMFGPGSAIAMPYIFGHPKPSIRISADDVLERFVTWIRKNMVISKADLKRIPTPEMFRHSGKVEIYDRDYIEKQGEIKRLPIPSRRFLDQLIEDRILDPEKIVWIGGSADDYASPYEHLKVALFEQANLAGNVFTTEPFRLVSYHRNRVTNRSLEAHLKRIHPDYHLELMQSNEIRTDDGGPHCLTQPLLREEI